MTEFLKRFPLLVMALFLMAILFQGADQPASAAQLKSQAVSGTPVKFPTKYPSAISPPAPVTIIDGKIGRQPVYTELVSRGVAPSEVLSVARSFKGVFDFRNARPKDEYQLSLSPQKKLQKLVYKTGLTNQYIAVRTDDGAFRTYREQISLEKKTVARTFTIESSLYLAVTGQGETGHLVAAFTDIFSWDIDFYLLPRKGDMIRVLFEKYYHKGRFVKYGKILAAQYIGRNQTFSAFYFDNGNQTGYYDENGVPLRKMFMRIPVKFGMRTSSFSVRRFHPISKRYKRHTGIDYGAPHGTPIHATAAGTVEFAGWRGGYGKLVILRHPNGFKTYYGHCSRLLVKKGKFVQQGQAIAKVGRTGNATGPHVHYETRINGKPVNPNRIKTARGKPLPVDQRARFDEVLQTRMQLMADRLFPTSLKTAGKAADLR